MYLYIGYIHTIGYHIEARAYAFDIDGMPYPGTCMRISHQLEKKNNNDNQENMLFVSGVSIRLVTYLQNATPYLSLC